ncbi:MAG: hypothetical protein HC767_02230, partial [Akkermansiaceae bacterium]|nr:hypothetical protein [Akkermansiaceae bacterium]
VIPQGVSRQTPQTSGKTPVQHRILNINYHGSRLQNDPRVSVIVDRINTTPEKGVCFSACYAILLRPQTLQRLGNLTANHVRLTESSSSF